MSVAAIVEVRSDQKLTTQEVAFNADVIFAANSLLSSLKKHWDVCGRDTAKIHLISGDPAEKILKFLTSENIDLLSMGSRGVNNSDTFNFGATASAVANHSTCSILLHHGPNDKSWSPTKPLNLLLPFDISDATKYAVDVLAASNRGKMVSADFVHYVLHNVCYGIDCSDPTKEDWPDKKKAIQKAVAAVERSKDLIVMGTDNAPY